MDLGADSLHDVLGDAEWFLGHYGFEIEQPPSATQLALKATGRAPERIDMVAIEAYTLPLGGLDRIFVLRRLPPVRERWLVLHELAEIHHARIRYVGADVEARCNAMASAMAAPRLAMRRAMKRYGHSVYDLALAMRSPQAATVLRIAEVCGRPCALLREAGPVVRGEPFVWPANENDWKALLRARGRRPDVHPLKIADERRARWAFMAAA
jgi:hypothetical protein